MTRDLFEEMEKKMKEMMQEGMSEGGRRISVKQTSEGTTVDVTGDLSDKEIDRLKEKYPDAEIRVEGESIEEKEPVIEIIDEESEEKSE